MSEFILLGNTTQSQMFGCVIKTDKHTIVIDGGTMGDGKQPADLLEQNANSQDRGHKTGDSPLSYGV